MNLLQTQSYLSAILLFNPEDRKPFYHFFIENVGNFLLSMPILLGGTRCNVSGRKACVCHFSYLRVSTLGKSQRTELHKCMWYKIEVQDQLYPIGTFILLGGLQDVV